MSGLTAQHGTLDLPSLLQEFHLVIIGNYAGFVVKTLFPELLPAARFYAALTNEVKAINRAFRMVFIEGPMHPESKRARVEMDLQITMVPNDVFAVIGIQVNVSAKDAGHDG